MIKKSQKSLYEVIKRWWQIALLSFIDKIVKIITAHRLTAAAETAKVLSETQMRNCINHSTEHVLNLITSQIQTVWESKCHIASLLSLNIAGVLTQLITLSFCMLYNKKTLCFNFSVDSLVFLLIVQHLYSLIVKS